MFLIGPRFPRRLFWLPLALLGAAAFCGLASCGSPCQSLADKICECQPSTSDQNACKEQVRASRTQRDATKAEEQVCSQLSDQCTCDAIERNDLSKCGIAKPAPR